jgi:stress response protein YsnF
VPRNERLTEIPHVRLEGSVTVIPVVEEVVVVEKALMLVQEIRIHRASSSERAEIPVTVRSEEAVIEREDMAMSAAHEPGEKQ